VERLAGQVWMTGADPAVFVEIEARAAVFYVSPGAAERRIFAPSEPAESGPRKGLA
jgi:hypothetical protein